MKKWLGLMVIGAISASVHVGSFAQEPIYRCGNEYTNDTAAAKRGNCKEIEGGQLTVVHSDPTSNKAAAGSAAAATPDAKSPRTGATQIDADAQKSRDKDARTILETELKRAQEKLTALKSEFNGGHPTKTAIELRNPQVFNERLESLKANIARQENDVASIQRELSRHNSN